MDGEQIGRVTLHIVSPEPCRLQHVTSKVALGIISYSSE